MQTLFLPAAKKIKSPCLCQRGSGETSANIRYKTPQTIPPSPRILSRLLRLLLFRFAAFACKQALSASHTPNLGSRNMSTDFELQTLLQGARDIALDISAAAVTAFESRCVLTRGECEGLHYSACRSRLPDGECTTTGLCSEAECGSVQDFSNPVGERSM